MATDRKTVTPPPLCPACFAKDIDPVILNYDPDDAEYYCVKCTYHGTLDQVNAFFIDLQRHRYGVKIKAY